MTRRPVMVATDFGARADRAVDRALLLGERWNCPVKVVHALDYAAADNADRKELDRRMRDCVGESGADVEFLYPEGSPPGAIATAAEEHDASLLVIGVARYNSIGDFILGTAVDHVLRKTRRPVLVVKQRGRRHYRNLIAATDFSPSSRYAIEQGANMLPDCAMHVVHAYHVSFESWQKADYVQEEVRSDARKRLDGFMQELAEQPGAPAEPTSALVKGTVPQAITREVKKYESSLVVIGSHGTSGFRQATIGSVASEMLRFTPVDTLVVNTAGANA